MVGLEGRVGRVGDSVWSGWDGGGKRSNGRRGGRLWLGRSGKCRILIAFGALMGNVFGATLGCGGWGSVALGCGSGCGSAVVLGRCATGEWEARRGRDAGVVADEEDPGVWVRWCDIGGVGVVARGTVALGGGSRAAGAGAGWYGCLAFWMY